MDENPYEPPKDETTASLDRQSLLPNRDWDTLIFVIVLAGASAVGGVVLLVYGWQ